MGTLAGLERGEKASGVAFDALVDRLAVALGGADVAPKQIHRAAAPPEARFLDVEAPAPALGVHEARWQPGDLRALLAAVPRGESLAVYGRAPNWVYAALALHALPSEIWLFDARQGWMELPALPPLAEAATVDRQSGWDSVAESRPGYAWIELITNSQYLNPDQPDGLPLPLPPPAEGLVLSGRIPNWLLMAAARRLSPAYRWLAVHQPQTGAVVVHSTVDSRTPGGVLTV